MLAAQGTGVLLVEHNVPMVLEHADEVTVLHQGRLLFHGTPDELRLNRDVASAFLGEDAHAVGEAE
jgi:ABC-type branched-subunit amino acid transport system ATPase component